MKLVYMIRSLASNDLLELAAKMNINFNGKSAIVTGVGKGKYGLTYIQQSQYNNLIKCPGGGGG